MIQILNSNKKTILLFILLIYSNRNIMSIDCYNSDKSVSVNKSNINGSIYLYKNDPKVVNKGVNVSNFRHAHGGRINK